ncbi:putative mitochondrial chaperone BCS1-B [Lachnellula arida]|uniref:Putative mitochondrial chaperone BCS1-B n=1 Tax=Lachnellula arida TaxID=1316785 RepID=A0A8T9BE66_9HELO|nr:putative mitochondrial chaperone BCS1-B [Lachnellula arida]
MKQRMALDSILGSAFPTGDPENSTDSAHGSIPGFSSTTLLETFIPGYGPIHKFLLFTFGFDVTVLVSFGAALWISARLGRSIWAIIWSGVSNYFMAEITVSSTDEIHGHLIQFLAHQYKISSSRRLMAETPSKSAWEMDSEDTETPESTVDANGNIKWLNFSNQEAKSQPRFTPAIGSHNFWHNGTYFQLRRKEVSVLDELGGGATTFKDKEVLTLSCFGRSTDPIKALIQHAKEHYHSGHKAKTIIKRPAPKDMRRFGGRGSWVKIAERPCRPMKTVVLDEERKMDVLADINEYLNPATARWYANRGIPYRRGYLFYGPPGTGKTSLTFALAGVFGLDIHVVSLLEPTLTEEELGMLFTNLPARCIVLLEDIDTAGLVRNEQTEAEETKPQTNGETKNDFNVVDLTKALKKANQQSEEERKKGISLSGLLNIIDGVASHEGRVLVMTTNHPEKLDEALIRPGRVDHQVGFDNATQTQVKQLFERMYNNDLPRTKLIINTPTPAPPVTNDFILTPPATPTTPKIPNGHLNGSVNGSAMLRAADKEIDELKEGELEDIASAFAGMVPDDEFSPAEIQGFLLKRKKDPKKALLEVDMWVQGMMEQKKRGTKLLKVQ